MAAPLASAPRELDEVTLRRAQRGDEDACRALVERYQAAVFALIGRTLGGAREELVEDLAQETFLQVFASLSRFSALGPARLSTWILTIASRRTIDELRKRRPSSTSVEELASVECEDTGHRSAAIAAALQRAVLALSPEYRAAFLLREYHGFDYAEIARALQIEAGTVKSRLSRARAALRRELAQVRDDR